MKKNLFVVCIMVAIAVCAVAVLTSCKDKTPKIPEGTPIGEFKYFEQTDEATGAKTIAFIDAEQNVKNTSYTSLTDHQDFIIATDGADGGFVLLNLKGGEIARCDSFKVQPLYAVGEEAPTSKFIKIYERSGNKHIFSVPALEKMENAGGKVMDEILPLANGDMLYKQNDSWGIANATEVLSTAVCTDIAVIATKDGKVFYWIKRPEYTGIINQVGEGIKRMSAAQFKQLKRKGQILWEEAGVSAVLVKKI